MPATSRLVHSQATEIVQMTRTPGPFNLPPAEFDKFDIERKMTAICDQATQSVRIGMMISSRFRVETHNGEVQVWHVREAQGDRLWMVFHWAPRDLPPTPKGE